MIRAALGLAAVRDAAPSRRASPAVHGAAAAVLARPALVRRARERHARVLFARVPRIGKIGRGAATDETEHEHRIPRRHSVTVAAEGAY
ncbi:MAG: hypothetical protein SangKO_019380 [Sandaracinaceae bacterium]